MNRYRSKPAGKTALLLILCLIFSFVLSVSAFAADRNATGGSRSYTADTNGNGSNGTTNNNTNRSTNGGTNSGNGANNRHYTDRTNNGTDGGTNGGTNGATNGNSNGAVIGNGGNGSIGNGANGNNNSPSANGGGVVTDDTTTRNDMYGGVVGDTSRPIEDVIPGDDEIDGDTRDVIHDGDKDSVRDEGVMGEEEGEVLGVADADGSVVGIVIAILIAVAVIVLIIALIPKGTSSM